jgi:hypothetical protein
MANVAVMNLASVHHRRDPSWPPGHEPDPPWWVVALVLIFWFALIAAILVGVGACGPTSHRGTSCPDRTRLGPAIDSGGPGRGGTDACGSGGAR